MGFWTECIGEEPCSFNPTYSQNFYFYLIVYNAWYCSYLLLIGDTVMRSCPEIMPYDLDYIRFQNENILARILTLSILLIPKSWAYLIVYNAWYWNFLLLIDDTVMRSYPEIMTYVLSYNGFLHWMYWWGTLLFQFYWFLKVGFIWWNFLLLIDDIVMQSCPE